MTNELTGVVTKEAAVDIKAMLVGTAMSKSPAPAGAKAAVKDNGNTSTQPENPERIKKSVQEAVDFFEKIVQENQFNLKFSVDEKSNAIVVQLLEKGTGKLIRQIPSEEILKLKQRISDLLGMIYDEKM